MIAVLTDSINSKINECFGVSSHLQLPLFSETYGEELLKNIRYLSPEKIYVLSENSFDDGLFDNVEIIKNLNEISHTFVDKSDDYVCFFFSDVFFEVSEDLIEIMNSGKGESLCIKNDSEQVVSFILPKSKFRAMVDVCDFTKDSPQDEFSIKITLHSYSKYIVQPEDYRALICDVFSSKVKMDLPEIAQGVYAENKIPQGDFVIIPPVFFGEGIQIESGCVIGPNTAIMDNCLVSRNTNLRNSLLCKGSYISSSCFLDGVICCENVSVRRNSIVFPRSVIGRDCVIGEESLIENDSYVRPFTQIDTSENRFINYKRDGYQSPAGFYGYTPEKAALLGAAIGMNFNSPTIAVASDGEMNATALKLSLLGGLITTGAYCYDFGNTFLSAMHYFMDFCELDCAVFISGNKGGTVITVFKKGYYQLTNSDYYNIKNIMLTSNIKRSGPGECKNIRQIHGMQRMYIRNLISKIDGELDFLPSFECENRRIQSLLEITLSKISVKSGKKRIVFKINREGTMVTAESNSEHFSYGKLTDVVSHFSTEKGDVYLKDITGKNEELWQLDGIILCFEIIGILHKNNITLNEAVKMLPDFYIAENTVSSKIPLNRLLSEISEKNNIVVKDSLFEYRDGASKVQINKMKDGSFKIAAKAVTVETAREIVGNLTEIISGYLT